MSAPIGRHRADRKRMAVTPGGREAVTHYQVIGAQNGCTHLTCRLETGRTHQIRVHMAYIGHLSSTMQLPTMLTPMSVGDW